MIARDAGVIPFGYEGGMLDAEIRYMEFTDGERPFKNPYDRRVKFCEVIVEPPGQKSPD